MILNECEPGRNLDNIEMQKVLILILSRFVVVSKLFVIILYKQLCNEILIMTFQDFFNLKECRVDSIKMMTLNGLESLRRKPHLMHKTYG